MTISEVCKLCDVTPDTLRYYEKVGAIPPVPRSANGLRDYTEDSLNWIRLAKCLRAAGLPIETISAYVTLYFQGDETVLRRKELLVEQRQILLEKITRMQEAVDRLSVKIDNYETVVIPAMEKFKR